MLPRLKNTAQKGSHLSVWSDKEKVKQRKCKEKQLKDAAEYCLVNNC